MGDMTGLYREYKESLRIVNGMITENAANMILYGERGRTGELARLMGEKKLLSGMKADLEYVIRWLRCGHDPNDNKPIYRVGVGEKD